MELIAFCWKLIVSIAFVADIVLACAVYSVYGIYCVYGERGMSNAV